MKTRRQWRRHGRREPSVACLLRWRGHFNVPKMSKPEHLLLKRRHPQTFTTAHKQLSLSITLNSSVPVTRGQKRHAKNNIYIEGIDIEVKREETATNKKNWIKYIQKTKAKATTTRKHTANRGGGGGQKRGGEGRRVRGNTKWGAEIILMTRRNTMRHKVLCPCRTTTTTKPNKGRFSQMHRGLLYFPSTLYSFLPYAMPCTLSVYACVCMQTDRAKTRHHA